MRSANKHALPPLVETCKGFAGFSEDENRSGRIVEMLGKVIERCRSEVPQKFYPVREVAAFFDVSLNTVQRAYRRLDREGVLSRVRSFETVITPRVSRPRFAIRGVIAMPIWMPGFVKFKDWRMFFIQLEAELSHQGYLLEPVFYQQEEEFNPAFIARVLKFNPDYVIWSCPSVTDRSALLGIVDTGVPLLVVQNCPGEFPGRIYRLSYERALQQGLNEWQASGEVDNVIIPQEGRFGIANCSATGMIHSAVRSTLPYRFEVYPSNAYPLAGYMRQLAPNPRTALIFDDDIFYLHLCLLMPEAMLKLLGRHRVMVVRDAVFPSESVLPEIPVDALLFPGKLAAKRIVRDITKGKAGITSEHTLLEAEWRPRLPLTEMARTDVFI